MMSLSNLVRLIPLKLSEIPSHPNIEEYLAASPHKKHDSDDSPSPPTSASSPDTNLDANGHPCLGPFLISVLSEATTFVDQTLPSTFKPKGTKSNPPATAKIEVSQRMISSDEISKIPWTSANIPRKSSRAKQSYGEAWFARKSVHANYRDLGTANWREFDEGLRVNHSEHEREYTPDVFDSYKVLDWNDDIGRLADGLGEYADVKMMIYEMCHKLPFPLAPRVFPVLVVHARTGSNGLIVVQIPVNLRSLPQSFYSSGRNQTEGDSPIKRKKPVFAVYTSIERCVLTESDEIEWIMATASDAKGNLPMAAQKMGVPGAIVNDVGLFMQWTANNRTLT